MRLSPLCNAHPQEIDALRVAALRIWDESGAFRVIYTARLTDAVYVLHAFQKKTQMTSKRDIEIAKDRFAQLMRVEK